MRVGDWVRVKIDQRDFGLPRGRLLRVSRPADGPGGFWTCAVLDEGLTRVLYEASVTAEDVEPVTDPLTLLALATVTA